MLGTFRDYKGLGFHDSLRSCVLCSFVSTGSKTSCCLADLDNNIMSPTPILSNVQTCFFGNIISYLCVKMTGYLLIDCLELCSRPKVLCTTIGLECHPAYFFYMLSL